MHSTHFIYCYMVSDIWERTTQIAKEETRFCHIVYSFWLAASFFLYAPSHRQDSTYHVLCYTSHGALAGTRNPPHEGSIRWPIAPWANALTTELHYYNMLPESRVFLFVPFRFDVINLSCKRSIQYACQVFGSTLRDTIFTDVFIVFNQVPSEAWKTWIFWRITSINTTIHDERLSAITLFITYLFICLFVCLFVCLIFLIFNFFFIFLYIYIYIFIYLSIYVCICTLFIHFICLSVVIVN